MKWLVNVCSIVVLMLLAACQIPSGVDVGGAVRDGIQAGVAAADRNQDGILTNREIKDSKNDPMFWTAIGGALLGLLGLNGARKAQRETDELYDRVNAKT